MPVMNRGVTPGPTPSPAPPAHRVADSWRVRQAAHALRRGRLIAYPTEAVWGLGCDPLNANAVKRLLALKKRSAEKGLILIAAAFDQIEPFVEIPGDPLRRRIAETWPGPTTWVIPARRWVPPWLRGGRATLAVRVTAHPLAAALCHAFGGPIVSTSANKTGSPPARTALRVRQYFPGAELLYIAGPTQGLSAPSAIYDALSGARLR